MRVPLSLIQKDDYLYACEFLECPSDPVTWVQIVSEMYLGEKRKAIAIARNLKSMGMSISNISNATGLQEEEIKAL